MNSINSHKVITLRKDRYGGVIIDDSTVHHPLEELEERLTKVIKQ